MKTYTYTQSVRIKLAMFLLAAAGCTLLTSAAVRADANRDSVTRTESFSYAVDGRTVFLGNLAGEVTLSPSSGSKIEITATVVAGGDNAKDNLELIGFEDEVKGNRLELRTVYPTDQYDTYLYDRKGFGNSRSSFRYQGEKVVVGSGRRMRNGLEVHVDYDIKLPAGVVFSMTNGLGEMTAEGIDGDISLKNKSGPVTSFNTSGDIRLDTGSGAIKGTQHRGDLDADSGSGRVVISDVSGNVGADTGSGSITVNNIGGRLNADTGSGSVEAKNIGDSASVDTGSGRVELFDVTGSINVDTGSGSIDIESWKGGDTLNLDTGSGSISVQGDFAMVERMRADTGSGRISLVSTTMPNMKLKVSSRPGIDIDFPDMTNIRKTRSSFRGTIGSGAGRGEVDSGSGKVSFRLADI